MHNRKAVFVFVLAGVVGACMNEETVQTPTGDSPAAVQDSLDPQDLHTDLVENAVDAVEVMKIHVTQAELETALEQTEPRLRIGITKPLGKRIDLRAINPVSVNTSGHVAANGAIKAVDNGFVWSGIVESAGAGAMRVELVDFALPHGVSLYLYNDYGDVRGPYVGTGPLGEGWFWSHTIPGDRVHLQLRYTGVHKSEVLGKTSLAIGEVGHIDPAFVNHRGQPSARAEESNLCPVNAPCVEDATEALIPTAIQDAQDAVAAYTFTERGSMYLCSGGLIADDDDATNIPYFLTANHCVSKDRTAGSVETFFHRTTANTACVGPWYETGLLGATLITTGREGDYSLLELTQGAPADTKAMPWSSKPIASSDGAELYRISHPSGMPQAYSEHAVDADSFTCIGLSRGSYIYSTDILGATEGGSSGSPVYNANGQIVGQLYGACGSNLSDNCDAVANRTVDGAIASYADALIPWLGEPVVSCTSDADCPDDGEACNGPEACVSGTCQSGPPMICDDGDACNGLETCDNGACQAGTAPSCDDGDECTIDSCDAAAGCTHDPIPDCVPVCGAKDEACETGADCCSGRCHPKKKTCQ